MTETVDGGRVLLLSNDLIFGTKIVSTASMLGVSVETLKTESDVKRAIAESRVSLLIVDLNSAGDEALMAIGAAVTRASRPHVVAFGSHVDADLLDRAREAGADEVMPRSRFSHVLPQLLADHGGTTSSGPDGG